MSTGNNDNYDWSDPHHFHSDGGDGHDDHGDHGHHISSIKLLLGVLLALLALTALTVFSAKGEVWLVETFDVHISQLTNVIIAMSIASVKALLVCMYFMHLRHDNPINTYIMLFTVVVFGLFLTFPALDLATRDAVDTDHKGQVVAGGSGEFGAGAIVPSRRVAAMVEKGLAYAEEYEKLNPLPPVEVEVEVEPSEDAQAEVEAEGEGVGEGDVAAPEASLADAAAPEPTFITPTVADVFPPDNNLSAQVEWLDSGNPWEKDFWSKAQSSYWDAFYYYRKKYHQKLVRHPADDTDAFDRFLAEHPEAKPYGGAAPTEPSGDQRVVRRGNLLFTEDGESAAPKDDHDHKHGEDHSHD